MVIVQLQILPPSLRQLTSSGKENRVFLDGNNFHCDRLKAGMLSHDHIPYHEKSTIASDWLEWSVLH